MTQMLVLLKYTKAQETTKTNYYMISRNQSTGEIYSNKSTIEYETISQEFKKIKKYKL